MCMFYFFSSLPRRIDEISRGREYLDLSDDDTPPCCIQSCQSNPIEITYRLSIGLDWVDKAVSTQNRLITHPAIEYWITQELKRTQLGI